MWCADDPHSGQHLSTATLPGYTTLVHMAADIWPARLEGGSLFPTRMAQFLFDGRGGCSDTPAG